MFGAPEITLVDDQKAASSNPDLVLRKLAPNRGSVFPSRLNGGQKSDALSGFPYDLGMATA